MAFLAISTVITLSDLSSDNLQKNNCNRIVAVLFVIKRGFMRTFASRKIKLFREYDD